MRNLHVHASRVILIYLALGSVYNKEAIILYEAKVLSMKQ